MCLHVNRDYSDTRTHPFVGCGVRILHTKGPQLRCVWTFKYQGPQKSVVVDLTSGPLRNPFFSEKYWPIFALENLPAPFFGGVSDFEPFFLLYQGWQIRCVRSLKYPGPQKCCVVCGPFIKIHIVVYDVCPCIVCPYVRGQAYLAHKRRFWWERSVLDEYLLSNLRTCNRPFFHDGS